MSSEWMHWCLRTCWIDESYNAGKGVESRISWLHNCCSLGYDAFGHLVEIGIWLGYQLNGWFDSSVVPCGYLDSAKDITVRKHDDGVALLFVITVKEFNSWFLICFIFPGCLELGSWHQIGIPPLSENLINSLRNQNATMHRAWCINVG